MNKTEPPTQHSELKKIFFSTDGSRLRAGWRLFVHTVAYNGLLIFLMLPFMVAVFFLNVAPDNLFLGQAITFLATTLSVLLARRFLDKRPISNLGLELGYTALKDFIAGIVISFLMIGSIFLLMLQIGWVTFESFAWQSDATSKVLLNALLYLGLFVFVGWTEELLFRGYRLQVISEGLSPFWGVLLSSLWFGVLHLVNPNTEARIAVTIGIFLAGLYLAFGYLSTRQLWLPIGLHIGWNFFEGVVFGFPVSGLDIYRLTRITVTGPELWTGGAFGPEAGLIVLPGLLLGVVLIYIYAKFMRISGQEPRAGR